MAEAIPFKLTSPHSPRFKPGAMGNYDSADKPFQWFDYTRNLSENLKELNPN